MFPLSSLFKAFVRVGALKVIDADGKTYSFEGEPGPSVALRFHDPSLKYSLFFKPELTAGEAYMDARLTIEDGGLYDLLHLYSVNCDYLEAYPVQSLIRAVSHRLRRFQQNNKIGQARKNVAHHYDLGNEFYKLFLDRDMQYSCAFFESPDDTLEAAQRNKQRLIASKMNLKAGDKVLDIGCGWGGMALYLATLEDIEAIKAGATETDGDCGLGGRGAPDGDGLSTLEHGSVAEQDRQTELREGRRGDEEEGGEEQAHGLSVRRARIRSRSRASRPPRPRSG